MSISRIEHLYCVVDDILLKYHGMKNPIVAIFAAEDIAEEFAAMRFGSYSDSLVCTVSALSCRGLLLSYSEVCDMVDYIATDLQRVRKEKSWLQRKRKSKQLTRN